MYGTRPRLFSEMSGVSNENYVKVGRNAAFELKRGCFKTRVERSSDCNTYVKIETDAV